jgi:hypothetical protein
MVPKATQHWGRLHRWRKRLQTQAQLFAQLEQDLHLGVTFHTGTVPGGTYKLQARPVRASQSPVLTRWHGLWAGPSSSNQW